MRPYLVNARVAGVLFITATGFSLLGGALLRPLLSMPDATVALAAEHSRASAGAFFQLLAAWSCIGIAIAMYPVLRRHAEAMALGAVALRTVEGVLFAVGALGGFMLIGLGQTATAGADAGTIDTAFALLVALRDDSALIGTLSFYLGAALYYVVMIRSRLVPRWLSVWGFVGVVLGIIAGVAGLLGLTSLFSPIQVVLNLPIALNEMVLAVWLIVKGFQITEPAEVTA